jgi:hypothetical protein
LYVFKFILAKKNLRVIDSFSPVAVSDYVSSKKGPNYNVVACVLVFKPLLIKPVPNRPYSAHVGLPAVEFDSTVCSQDALPYLYINQFVKGLKDVFVTRFGSCRENPRSLGPDIDQRHS